MAKGGRIERGRKRERVCELGERKKLREEENPRGKGEKR